MAANTASPTQPEPVQFRGRSQSRRFSTLAHAGFALALLLIGHACGKKAEVRNELSELQKSFPAAAAPQATVPDAVSSAAANPTPYVQVAISAVQNNEYAKGVIALESAQRAKGLTPQQLMAIERAKQAMTSELLARAGRGDPKAKAELDAIEKTRSQ